MQLRRHGDKKSLYTLSYKLKDDGMDTGLRTKRQETEKSSRVGRGGGKRMITADGDVMGRLGIYLGGGKSQQRSAKEIRIRRTRKRVMAPCAPL
jgi:hypothetical protein